MEEEVLQRDDESKEQGCPLLCPWPFWCTVPAPALILAPPLRKASVKAGSKDEGAGSLALHA